MSKILNMNSSMMWASDIMLPHDPNGMLLDTRSESPFFTENTHFLDEINRRVPIEMEGFMMLDDYDTICDVPPPIMTSTSTQTASQPTRKIKPIRHPGLKLKTPIAYQKDTDPSVIPIQKDGMAVCEKCGAIGVKHAFYTKERRFCSLACAREYSELERQGQPIPKPLPVLNLAGMDDSHVSDSSLPPIAPVLPPLPAVDEPLTPPMKRNRAELANTYEWKNQLSEPGFVAAPVSCFKHAPIADCWDNITVGMKVEVENTDCDDFSESFPDSFWVATVLRIAGYKALLRYEGFGQNCSKDFWVSLCSSSVHSVGWCATRGKPLIPPKTIEDKYKDWKEFLVKRLTGARTLPSNFYNKVSESLTSRFRCGMNLEVVDKNRISRVKVATIKNIIGKRLHVMYYNAEADDNGFWCHQDSPLIHPVGWANRVGQSIDAPREYHERCNLGMLNADDATEEYFIPPKPVNFPPGVEFKEGMKLEAVDPLNLSSICVATVMKVLKENYIMIRIDSYDADESGADWFCYHASSPCIFPAGFCQKNSIPLTPPKGFEESEFVWDTYLRESNSTTAPQALFNRDIPPHGFVVGMRLEAADLMDPRLVCVGTVSRVVGRLLKVHFDGWEEEYDQWLDCESPDVYPVGWCHLVGHKLEGPRTPVKGTTAAGVKKKPRRRHKRGRGPAVGLVNKKVVANLGPSMAATASVTDAPPPQVATSMTNTRANLSDRLPREPAQATKLTAEIHHTGKRPRSISSVAQRFRGYTLDTSFSHTGDGVPEGNGLPAREPEMGQEPAGPDQSLPVSSEPSQPPIPRGRTATSYINSTAVSTKLIPRLVDSTGSSESGELVPDQWNVFDVGQFLRVNDCAAYCDSFSKKRIDGASLLSLTKEQIIELTGMKVGPSLKIYDLIQQLKIKVNPAQERMKAGLKKLL
ncbi:MBT domain-containing protein 1 isoform X2 [Anabrus simplex]|uniref:MBT domain-containing protein 1 isoform X2 n=1 Tax=Anabrus simplex TaxID=316456 RepID=UPI0035A2F1A7